MPAAQRPDLDHDLYAAIQLAPVRGAVVYTDLLKNKKGRWQKQSPDDAKSFETPQVQSNGSRSAGCFQRAGK